MIAIRSGRMSFPTIAVGIIIPAINHVRNTITIKLILITIQAPSRPYFTKSNSTGRIVENIVASSISMVIVNDSITRKRQISRSTGVINTATITSSTFVVDVIHNCQLSALFKGDFTIVRKATAIVASNCNNCAFFDFTVCNSTSQL